MSTSVLAENENVLVEPVLHVGDINIDKGNPLNLDVNYNLKDNQLYVECLLSGFSFGQNEVGSLHQDNEGHLRIYLNDEHIATLFERAFYLKNLPNGEHEVLVQVVQNDHTPYNGVDEVITISIRD
ncbi:hypothetical protein [Halalkalibacter sp. APA_J-10(15)]|uniref:hypothetical protein n=1 Tax=Halalkalibacter sp. APA_J-10(15) TaxID=2933805 RepID=UPI001FF24286|nr:hypothetical protein [Halalkalibacter sp. APA_J-10(15)]